MKDNLIILWEAGIRYRKMFITTLVLLVSLVSWSGYMGVTRTIPMISCTWEAVIIQSVPSEKWRFQWLPSEMKNQCQYRLNSRWISLMKSATDVGIETGTEGVEDLGG